MRSAFFALLGFALRIQATPESLSGASLKFRAELPRRNSHLPGICITIDDLIEKRKL
jgi:hypothetical protein